MSVKRFADEDVELGDWHVVSGDANHRLSPDSPMFVNRNQTWIVGPVFHSTSRAKRFLGELKAAIDLVRGE